MVCSRLLNTVLHCIQKSGANHSEQGHAINRQLFGTNIRPSYLAPLCDFAQNKIVRAFQNLIDTCSIMWANADNDVSIAEFKSGTTMLCQDLTPDHCGKLTFQLLKVRKDFKKLPCNLQEIIIFMNLELE